MDTIDKAWREILSSENQRTLILLLERSLTSVLRSADKLGFIKLIEGELDTAKGCNELVDVQKIYGRKYGQEQRGLRTIEREFVSSTKRGNRQKNIRPEEAQRISNLINVSDNAARYSLYFRNLWAHKNAPVYDPGHTAALAGTVLHLTEQLAPGDETFKASVEKLRRDASSALKLCSARYEEDDEQQGDSRHDPMSEEEQEGPDILLEKLEEFRSEWEKNFGMLIQRIPDEEKWRSMVSEAAEQSVRKIRAALHQSSSDLGDGQDDFEEFWTPLGEEESGDFEAGRAVSPFLTPIQAENRLIALRDRIKNENPEIRDYHNALQRKLVRQMIEGRITDRKQWERLRESDGPMKEWHEHSGNDPKIMDKQLKKYGKEIFAIIKSIADMDDDISF